MKALYYVQDKSSTLAPYRHSLLLLKIGCPISCAEFLPVEKAFFDACEEGMLVELNCRVTRHTKVEAEEIMLANLPVTPKHQLKWNTKCDGTRSCEAEDPNLP